MRPALFAAVPVLALALAGPMQASALNPQPLPPRIHPMSHDSHRFEPPDPCLKYHNRHARDRCEAQRRHDDHHDNHDHHDHH